MGEHPCIPRALCQGNRTLFCSSQTYFSHVRAHLTPRGRASLTVRPRGDRLPTRRVSPSLLHIPRLRGGSPPLTQSREHLQTQLLLEAAQKALEESCGRALALGPLPPQPCAPGAPLEGRLPCAVRRRRGRNTTPRLSLACLPHLVRAQWHGSAIAPRPLPSPPTLQVTPCLLHGKGEGGHGCHTFGGGRQTGKSNLRLSQTFCHFSCQRYENKREARNGENNKFLPQALIAADVSSFSTTNFNCTSTPDKTFFKCYFKCMTGSSFRPGHGLH